MNLNITHTNSFQFENRENLRNTAKNILARQGANQETSQKILEQDIFNQAKVSDYNPQLAIIKASSQININDKLKETLKYLKSNANKKTSKRAVLGELWETLNKEETNYKGELLDFEIDKTITNIFAAA